MNDNPNEESVTVKSRNTSYWRVVVTVVVLGFLLYFIARSIWTNWENIRQYSWAPQWGWLGASLVVAWIDFILINQLWRRIVIILSGRQLGSMTAYRIAALSNLGKYLPGKVWAFLGMIVMLKREGYAASLAFAAATLHQAFTVIAGGLFIMVILGGAVLAGIPWPSIILGLGVCLLILMPPVFTRFLNFGLRMAKREPIERRLSYQQTVGLFGAYLIAWLLYGSSLWLMLKGINLEPGLYWAVIASFDAAYLIGFLAVFAPSGIGVREGILIGLLSPFFGTGTAALIAVIARIWVTIIEIIQLTPLVGKLSQIRDMLKTAMRSNDASF